jgi:hypothetical protein
MDAAARNRARTAAKKARRRARRVALAVIGRVFFDKAVETKTGKVCSLLVSFCRLDGVSVQVASLEHAFHPMSRADSPVPYRDKTDPTLAADFKFFSSTDPNRS